jgi:hypothetical protein
MSLSHLGQWKLRAGENLCEEVGKITEQEVQEMTCDLNFLVVKTWNGQDAYS